MGPTTRRQWNEWIAKKDQRPSKEPVPGQKPLKESARMQSPPAQKSHSTASIRSSSRGSANSDHIVSQPSVPSVKAKSSVTSSSDTSTSERRKPGRPKNKSRTEIHATATKRKYQLQTKNKVGRPSVGTTTTAPTKQQDYMSALDMLHQQTLFTSSQMYEGPPKGCSDVNLSSLKSPVVPAVQSSPEQRDIDALETYLANHRSLMVAFMRQFRMPEYRQYLMECCEKEVAKNKNLLLRQEQLSRQINHLQEEGLDLLKCRISDLGLFATSPAELLNKAKEIVLHHKELQNKVNQLQGEVNGLEQQNQMYVNCIEEKDKEILQNGMLQSLGYPESQSAKETKENILREISSALTHKRALLHECVRMETEISAIVANIPPDRALEVILANRQIHMEAATTITSPIAQTFGVTSTGENFMSSTPVTSGVPLKIESPNVFTFANATTSTTPTTTTPAVTTTSKRGRQNSGKTGRSPRRSKATPAPVRLGEGSQVTGSDGAACQNTDEIEEKIRDIVRKALSVDSAAKSAEKERRAARNAERRKEKSARGFRAGGAGRPIEPRDGEAHRGSMHDSSMVNNSINSIVSAIASNSAIDMTAVEVRNMSQPPSAVVTSSSTLINTAAVATFSGAGLVPVFPQELPSSSASPMENRPSQPTALTQPEMSVSRGSSEDTESASETETTNDSSKDFSMIQPKEDDTGAKDTGELSVCDSSETDEPKNLVIDEPMDTQPSIVNKLYISTSADKLQSVRLCSDVVISRPSSVPVLSGVTREFSIANIISTSSDTASAIYPPRVASVPGTVGSTDFSQTKSPAIIAKTTTPVLPVSTVVSNFLGFTQSDVSCLSPSSSGNSLFGTNRYGELFLLKQNL